MAAVDIGLTKDSMILSAEFRVKLKTAIANILPTGGWSSSSLDLPPVLSSDYLTTRASLLNDINNIIDTFSVANSVISQNSIITPTVIYELFKRVFLEMGRCHRVCYSDYDKIIQTATAQTLANSISTSAGIRNWAYFKANFSPVGKKVVNSNDLKTNNGTATSYGYNTYPDISTWSTNTRLPAATSRIAKLSTNQIIEALNGVEAQLDNFNTEWSNRANTWTWWDGTQNASNKGNAIFFARYWCHSNCHSNCYSNDRSRR